MNDANKIKISRGKRTVFSVAEMMGVRYGRLVVTGDEPYVPGSGRRRLVCKCDCGKEVAVAIPNLLRGLSKSCGCLKKELTGQRNWKGAGEVSGAYVAKLKRRADGKGDGQNGKRPISFNITAEYLWSLFLEQGGCCALTGLPLTLARNPCGSREIKSREPRQTASVDRIDSRIGYVVGNVQWVMSEVNRMKWDLGQERFVELCKLVVKRERKRKAKNLA